MKWINFYGIAIMAVILIPNIVFAATHKDGFENLYRNKIAEVLEQTGRFASLVLMCVNIPGLCAGFIFDWAEILYIAFGFGIAAVYCLCWILFWKGNSTKKALVLSVLPSALFIICGVLSLNFPLLAAAVIFAPAHILISYKNAALTNNKKG